MESAQVDKKKDLLERFLVNLGQFLERNSVVSNDKISIVFIQKPQKSDGSLISRGVVRIGDDQYIVNIELNENDSVEVESDAFWYYLKLSDVEKFLEEVER